MPTFNLPDVGEGLADAEILTWHVSPGDAVEINQVIVEIETAKAAVELPSPYAGTVTELLAAPGDTVAVGAPIISISDGPAPVGSDAPGAVVSRPGRPGAQGPAVPAVGSATVSGSGGSGSGAAEAGGSGSGAMEAGGSGSGAMEAGGSGSGAPVETGGAKIGEVTADGRIATLVGYVAAPGAVTRRRRRPPADSRSAEPAEVAVPLAKPPVRKLARELGIDLRSLTGSGPSGVITRDDVRAGAHPTGNGASAVIGTVGSRATVGTSAVGAPGTHTAVGAVGTHTAVGAVGAYTAVDLPGAPTAGMRTTGAGAAGGGAGGARRVPVRGVRKATAEAMVTSAFTAPHVTEFLTVDVTPMIELRDRLRAHPEWAEVKLSPLTFAAKAVCLAARRTPEVNAGWHHGADGDEIVYHDRVQLGIAADTPRGLIVPKIRDADLLGFRELALALTELTATARAGASEPRDLVNGTFTITNVGVFGVDTGTPIINPGESAILALGAVKQAPWVVCGQLAVRTVCQLALSFDHRVVDGAQGSRFLADVGALLADPGLAFTY